jgi:hypothetical protein
MFLDFRNSKLDTTSIFPGNTTEKDKAEGPTSTRPNGHCAALDATRVAVI